MKRILLCLAASVMLFGGCSEINERLDNLEQSVDAIQNTQIASLQQQVVAINSTISNLGKTDTDLKDYILVLQKTASSLQEELESTNSKITELKTSLEDEIDSEMAGVLVILENLKSDTESELSSINGLISDLQSKDAALEEEIKELKKYVDDELAETEDWAEATFVTLKKHNELADIVAAVSVDADAIKTSIIELEERLNEKIAGIDGTNIDESIAEAVRSVTADYTSAISEAGQEITAAYEKTIEAAIDELETSMKSWVNTQLSGYYTIAESNAKLEALQTALEGKIIASENSIMNYIAGLEAEISRKVNENSKLISSLQNSLSSLSEEVVENANDIIQNAKAIEANAESIRSNTQSILANKADIEANAELIADNKVLIASNNTLIKQNQDAISLLHAQVGENEQAIMSNASEIAKNAVAINTNAELISNNAAAIADNLAAITANAADITALQEELVETTKEITQAYKNAIETAITKLDGELRDHVASEVAAINEIITALTERVTALEKEVKNIKVSIYNIQGDISVLQEQVAAILSRIQSISYVPKFADGNATMYYTNSNGVITAGNATLDFELQPASTAIELLSVWETALSAKAVYTLTRAAGDFVNLTIESATATDGILTVVISGKNLEEGFFRSEISANVRLQISDGNNQISSEYVNMVPWTTDNIYIPDENFKTLLLAACDANNDGEISAEEAEEITSLDISATIPQITSLEGIEYFTNLETLDCSYNRIGSLNLTSNTKLKELLASSNLLESVALPSSITTLDLSNNKLSTVDVSKMKELTSLNVTNNKLGSLNLSQNKQLTEVLCLNNQLTALDVSNLAKLAELNCSKNQISRLDLSENANLTSLDASKNALTILDVTACGELTELSCSENQLTKLYISGLSKIKVLDCSDNSLTEINLTGCEAVTSLDCSNNALASMNIVPIKALQSLDCSNNALTMLDVSNNASLVALDCSENPALLKLWVKDDAQQSAMHITKDETTTYYYNNGGLYIPDAALKSYLVNNYDDDGDEEISIAEADNITMINCSGKGVTDLTGVEACTNLVTLNCSNNTITTIKLPSLTALRTLTCNGNPIEHIDVDGCTSLQYLNLQGVTTNAISNSAISIDGYSQASTLHFTAKNTPFTSFTVKNSADLAVLEFYGEFTDVAVTDNSVLESLVFHTPAVNATLSGNSSLKGIDVSAMGTLESLDVQKCCLQTLDVTKNLALTSLVCNNNELTSLDVSNNTSLVKFYCNDNKLPKINVTVNTALQEFDVSNNLLSALNVRNNTALTYLSVSNNAELSILNVDYNTALETLYAEGLAIGELNIVENSKLSTISLINNDLLSVVYVWDDFMSYSECLYVNHNFTFENNSGTTLRESYVIGSYVTPIGCKSNSSGIICATDYIMSMDETLCTSLYSAKSWCDSYDDGHWFLPTDTLLQSIYLNKAVINQALSECSSRVLTSAGYWSSTEYSRYGDWFVYVVNLKDGSKASALPSSSSKSYEYYARAVRSL